MWQAEQPPSQTVARRGLALTDYLTDGDAKRHLDPARVLDLAGQREHLGAAALVGAVMARCRRRMAMGYSPRT
jgi:hypothetical protein